MERRRAACVAPLLMLLLGGGVEAIIFYFANQCAYPIWVGTLAGASSTPLAQTGFQLDAGATSSLPAPDGWSGRFWGRTGCSTDQTGRFSCATADCGTGRVDCNGAGAIPPATLAEITVGVTGLQDFYDISLVDGYNLPMSMTPVGGQGRCLPASCTQDLNLVCPTGLRVEGADGRVVACKSACEAFGEPRYCCTGAFGGPGTCKPSYFSSLFKSACPMAYSYAYDDPSSTFTCGGTTGYVVAFCPA